MELLHLKRRFMKRTCGAWSTAAPYEAALSSHEAKPFQASCFFALEKGKKMVAGPGIEPGTQGFSVPCSTDWAIPPLSWCHLIDTNFSKSQPPFSKKLRFFSQIPFFAPFYPKKLDKYTFLCHIIGRFAEQAPQGCQSSKQKLKKETKDVCYCWKS